MAICAALSASGNDVLAVTAVEGCVDAERVTANVECIVENIDPKKIPRTGAAVAADHAIAVDTRFLHGDDGLGNVELKGSTFLHRVPSDKLIVDLLRKHPSEVSIICLGPLTNIARVLKLEPNVATLIDQLVIVGGSLDGIGNITPAAEFNMYFDPVSAREVFQSAITKTLIPLNLTRQVDFGFEFYNQISTASCPDFLKASIQHFFQSFRRQLGLESIQLHDAVGLVAALNPRLLSTSEFSGDVEPGGEITRGVTVFDQRPHREWQSNMSVAVEMDTQQVYEELIELICSS